MKKCKFIITMFLVVSMLTGCMGQQMAMTVNQDGSCQYELTYLYEKGLYDETKTSSSEEKTSPLESGDFIKEERVIEGKTYYAFKRSFSFANIQEMGNFLLHSDIYYNRMIQGSANASLYDKEEYTAPFTSLLISNMRCIGTLNTDSTEGGKSKTVTADTKDSSISYKTMGVIYEFSLTLPEPITESNGAINGNTVTWTADNFSPDGKIVAGTASQPVISTDAEKPVISGVANGKYYKEAKRIVAQDNVSVKTLLLNGKDYKNARLTVDMEGKHTMVATDNNNNSTQVAFTIDKTLPRIRGVKYGKTYRKKVKLRFSDKLSGIKWVKMNGKKRNKKQVVVKKKGKYTVKVMDKAGNTTSVKFQIKAKRK